MSANRHIENRESDRENAPTTFEDLEVYQVARGFRKLMYEVARQLPEFEKFGMVPQVRRAALSLTNNIAEGHGRFHFLDQIKFMFQSRGSLQELIDDLITCEDERYLPQERIAELKNEGWRVRQLIDGYIRYLRRSKSSASVREDAEHAPNYDSRLSNYDEP